MAFDEDLDVFLADFGTDAVLDGAGVRGIFDDAYELAALGGVGMSASLPRFTLPTASVPSAVVGKTLVVAGVSYAVAEHRPDGTGLSELRLEVIS